MSALCFLAAAMNMLLACDGPLPQSVVVGTGNAGRVAGAVTLNGVGILSSTRLIQIMPGNVNRLVGSSQTDSSGAFGFDSIPFGKYFVEAWQNGQISGRSSEFVLQDSLAKIIVVLVKPIYVSLDLRTLGMADSVYLNYPGNPAVQKDSIWEVRGLANDTGLLYTRIADLAGGYAWLKWKLIESSGQVRLIGLNNSASLDQVSVDTSGYFPTKHTVALWNFDSISETDSRVRDLSPYHNDLVLPSGKYLVPSPHKMALDLGALPLNPISRIACDSLPSSLQLARTGSQTIRMRLKLEALPIGLTQIVGTLQGFQIGLNDDGQVQVTSRVEAEAGTWDWNYFYSPIRTVGIGKWTDLTVTRTASGSGVSLWIDRSPVSLFSLQSPAMKIRELSNDTFGLSNSRWNGVRSRILLDELEISDSVELPNGYGVRSTFPIVPQLDQREALSYSFNDAEGKDTVLRIDTSGILEIGGARNLYIKLTDLSEFAGRSVAYGNLRLILNLTDLVSQQQFYQVFRAYSTFEKKIATSKLPIPGVDYDTVAISSGYNACSPCGLINFKLTSEMNEWAQNPNKNFGVVIKPRDKALPNVRFPVRYTDGVDVNHFTAWLQ